MYLYIYIFIYMYVYIIYFIYGLHWVLVVACRIFSCNIRDLVP